MSATPIKNNIAVQHLDQLSKLPVLTLPGGGRKPRPQRPKIPIFAKDEFPTILHQWSEKNKSSIEAAVRNKVFGGPDTSPINWHNAFLAFMEASTVYLRDWTKVVQATNAYRDHKYDEAIQALNDSVANIDKVAAIWGMKFQMLCDLITEHSSEHSWLDGPYCGAFYSQDPEAPFIGIAFKGTNPENIHDDLVDMDFSAEKATNGNVYNTNVSTGAYNGLFGTFGGVTPFSTIYDGIQSILKIIPNNTGDKVVVHVAGHSLGGSYSSLCFTEFTETGGLPPGAILGDLYTFGSPRNGQENFAVALRDHLGSHTGSSWRITNNGDPIPRVPPVGFIWGSYIHVDTHYEIDPEKSPVKCPTEIGTGPWGTVPLSFGDHVISSYYTSLQKAMTS